MWFLDSDFLEEADSHSTPSPLPTAGVKISRLVAKHQVISEEDSLSTQITLGCSLTISTNLGSICGDEGARLKMENHDFILS